MKPSLTKGTPRPTTRLESIDGIIRPLTNLVRAEGNHIDSVSFLMKKYGVKIDANPFDKRSRENKESYWLRLGIPSTKEEGFAKAIKLEKEQGPLYDKLSIGMPDDVKQVFARLKDVSVNRHLVTLERAASGAGSGNGFGGGNGPGNGRGNGQGTEAETAEVVRARAVAARVKAGQPSCLDEAPNLVKQALLGPHLFNQVGALFFHSTNPIVYRVEVGRGIWTRLEKRGAPRAADRRSTP